MPASVTSKPPQLDELRTYSNDSIHVDREVIVVSTPENEAPPKTIFPTVENMSNGHARPQSSYAHGATGAPASQLNRWKSESGLSDRVYHLKKSSVGSALLESNRESMKALSEFLMTRDPPPTNWVSIPSSDDDRSIKKAAFKMFGRTKSKKSKKKKLLKLPDSAVAATTSSGSRHIAISIPLEGWPNDEKQPTKSDPPRPQSKPALERPAVTVHPLQHGTPLKPVAEVRESSPSLTPPESKSKDGKKNNRISQAESDITPAAEILGPEATRTLENYYLQLNRQQKRESTLSAKSGLSTKSASSRPQRSYVTIPPITRQDSQRTDPRHSAGTTYSTASIASPTSHSRGASSSASTAPSATASVSRKLDLPARHSSLTKISPSILSELAQTANEKPQDEPPAPSVLSRQSADGSIVSGTTTSRSPSTVFGIAETAQNYSAGTAGLQTVSRGNTPKPPSPAPTKRLPAIPVNQSAPSPPHQSTTSPIQITPTPIKQTKASSPGGEANAEESLQVTRQSRQDRVKARKQRDMAIIREKSNVVTRAPLESGTGNNNRIPPQNTSLLTTPPRNPKRRSASQDPLRKKATMTFSPIMVVASTAPSAIPRASPPPSTNRRSDRLSPQDSPVAVRISPRNSLSAPKIRNRDTQSSLASSYVGSDSDTIPLPQPSQKRDSNSTNRSLVPTHDRDSNSTSRSLVSSPARSSVVSGTSLDARRQERRSKRNMSLKEKELDARLKKIERDNVMLLSTLSGIASSFQELHRLYPNGQRRGRGGRALLEDTEKAKKGGESGDEAGVDA